MSWLEGVEAFQAMTKETGVDPLGHSYPTAYHRRRLIGALLRSHGYDEQDVALGAALRLSKMYEALIQQFGIALEATYKTDSGGREELREFMHTAPTCQLEFLSYGPMRPPEEPGGRK
jgi:hypothetical protein